MDGLKPDTPDDKYRAENRKTLFMGEFRRMTETRLSGFIPPCSEMDEWPDRAYAAREANGLTIVFFLRS